MDKMYIITNFGSVELPWCWSCVGKKSTFT